MIGKIIGASNIVDTVAKAEQTETGKLALDVAKWGIIITVAMIGLIGWGITKSVSNAFLSTTQDLKADIQTANMSSQNPHTVLFNHFSYKYPEYFDDQINELIKIALNADITIQS